MLTALHVMWAGGPQGEGLQAAEEGVPAIRARSLSEDTVRIHPSPAPSASGPLQLSRLASQDSALLRDSDTAVLMSRLMASQQSMRAADSTAQRSGSALAVPPVREARGMTANLSDPGALATFLEASMSCPLLHAWSESVHVQVSQWRQGGVYVSFVHMPPALQIFSGTA